MFRAKLPSIFSTCHKMPRLTQPCQCDLQKTRNATRLKCCACHEKWRWTCPKCCACHENCNTSSENVAKVLRLPRKTTFDTLQNTSEPGEPFWSQKRKPKAVWPNGHEKRVWPWKKYVAVKKRFGREKVCIWPWKSVEWPWKHVKNMKTNIENHLAVKRAFGCEHVFSWTRAACTHFSWQNGSPGM